MAIAGKEIMELELPEDILLTAIIRNQQIIAPRGNTKIESGDTLYVLSPKAKRKQLKALLTLPVVPAEVTDNKQSYKEKATEVVEDEHS
ncbi:K(+)/H(+) antiporter NhaP2 [compost metagenome]